MKLRTGLVLLAVFLVLAGCAPQAQPPQTYLEALALLAEENGLSLGQEEQATIREDAALDAQALGETTDPEILEAEYLTQALEERLAGALFGELQAPEEEVQGWYQARLEAVEKAFAEDPGRYKNQQESYDLYGGAPPLVIPPGYVRFKHILVEEEQTAQEIHARLEAGESFGALLAELGTDPGMTREPYKTLGYLTGPYEFPQDIVAELKAAALSLEEVGDYTLVRSPAGYHIVLLTQKLEPRTIPPEEARDSIQALLDSQLRRQKLQELAQQRMAG